MPIFEYRCAACGHLEEVLQKHTDPAPATCAACGKDGTLSKEVSASAFHLKGGGWYKDLYSSAKKDGGKGEARPETKSESKTDAKPGKKED